MAMGRLRGQIDSERGLYLRPRNGLMPTRRRPPETMCVCVWVRVDASDPERSSRASINSTPYSVFVIISLGHSQATLRPSRIDG